MGPFLDRGMNFFVRTGTVSELALKGQPMPEKATAGAGPRQHVTESLQTNDSR